jgi:hypothetical protein
VKFPGAQRDRLVLRAASALGRFRRHPRCHEERDQRARRVRRHVRHLRQQILDAQRLCQQMHDCSRTPVVEHDARVRQR